MGGEDGIGSRFGSGFCLGFLIGLIRESSICLFLGFSRGIGFGFLVGFISQGGIIGLALGFSNRFRCGFSIRFGGGFGSSFSGGFGGSFGGSGRFFIAVGQEINRLIQDILFLIGGHGKTFLILGMSSHYIKIIKYVQMGQ
jgi:hypothetical protein